MIFVTVGSMLPFDRLIRTMDAWSARHPEVEVHAQIGEGAFAPRHMKWDRMLTGTRFKAMVAASELIVAHAGTGSVFTALEARKPILLVPRYASLKEHTTDHQLHTANWLRSISAIAIAELNDNIDQKIEETRLRRGNAETFSSAAPSSFLEKIRQAVSVK